MLDHYLRAAGLKDEARTGWTLRGVARPESVADHSWGTAYLCLLYAGEARVDRERAVAMALVHDLAEASTGDVATRVAVMNDPAVASAKRERESAAMAALLAEVDDGIAAELRELWEEYEAADTEAARFVRDMNLIDMVAQAHRYEREGRYEEAASAASFPGFEGMDEFFATTAPRLSTELGARLLEELVARHNRLPAVAMRGGVKLRPEGS